LKCIAILQILDDFTNVWLKKNQYFNRESERGLF